VSFNITKEPLSVSLCLTWVFDSADHAGKNKEEESEQFEERCHYGPRLGMPQVLR